VKEKGGGPITQAEIGETEQKKKKRSRKKEEEERILYEWSIVSVAFVFVIAR
jgi:hypothetical protein